MPEGCSSTVSAKYTGSGEPQGEHGVPQEGVVPCRLAGGACEGIGSGGSGGISAKCPGADATDERSDRAEHDPPGRAPLVLRRPKTIGYYKGASQSWRDCVTRGVQRKPRFGTDPPSLRTYPHVGVV